MYRDTTSRFLFVLLLLAMAWFAGQVIAPVHRRPHVGRRARRHLPPVPSPPPARVRRPTVGRHDHPHAARGGLRHRAGDTRRGAGRAGRDRRLPVGPGILPGHVVRSDGGGALALARRSRRPRQAGGRPRPRKPEGARPHRAAACRGVPRGDRPGARRGSARLRVLVHRDDRRDPGALRARGGDDRSARLGAPVPHRRRPTHPVRHRRDDARRVPQRRTDRRRPGGPRLDRVPRAGRPSRRHAERAHVLPGPGAWRSGARLGPRRDLARARREHVERRVHGGVGRRRRRHDATTSCARCSRDAV